MNAKEIIIEIDNLLIGLGYRNISVIETPPIIQRIEVTLRMAQLYYYENHKLAETDKKWCEHYSQYIHFFSNEKLETLGDLYFSLINKMNEDNCFKK